MKTIPILLLAGVLIAFTGCAKSTNEEVMLIAKTESYHKEECAKVKMAKSERSSIVEAKRRNFKPCPYCKPVTL